MKNPINILVLGDSGSGKTTSLRNLDFSKVLYINPVNKVLPFKKKLEDFTGNKGNQIVSLDSQKLRKVIGYVNENRKDIKTIIIDDFQYLLSSYYVKRALDVGYTKFSELAKNAYELIMEGINSPKEFIVLSHSEFHEPTRSYKIKTIGKMLDEKIKLEGLFTIVLYSTIVEEQDGSLSYKMITNWMRDDIGNIIPAKSPMNMFENIMVDNDMKNILDIIRKYYE